MAVAIQLTHLVFLSPRLPDARVDFGPGLNLIYGPSNTGKSSILDAIDFMLGRSTPLKEIPQHDGYESILLGFQTSEGKTYTLQRSISGGDLQYYDGLHFSLPDSNDATPLRLKEPTKKIDSLPNFFLGMMGLSGKALKKNSRNETDRLTIRNFVSLFLVNETDIQKESSPYVSTQFTKKTVDRSRLRLMLTGVDDSALVPEEQEKQKLSREARLHLLSELISEQEDAIADVTGGIADRDQLEDQASALLDTLADENLLLAASEEDYRNEIASRNLVRQNLEKAQARLSEIQEMQARFGLLYQQYDSDAQRLDNLIEAGTLFVAFPTDTCPLCGADASQEHPHSKCDGDAEAVVEAANNEKGKIAALRSELDDVLQQLGHEEFSIKQIIPDAERQLSDFSRNIEKIRPLVSERREKYSEVVSTKTNVDRKLALFDDLERLEQKRREIEEEAPDNPAEENEASILPTKSLHNLSQVVADLLKDWGLTDASQVHYEKETDDFVIGGKHRVSNGKGHRALTHAAATLALLKYTEERDLPYSGFVVLDSPLLAYEKPELDEENLAQTDINQRFFDSLNSWKTRQVIVLENKKSIPEAYEDGVQIIHFTKSETRGRYGFFPVEASG